MILYCGHGFCLACIKYIHCNQQIKCPNCKRVDSISLDQIIVNYHVLSQMELMNEHKKEFEKHRSNYE